ncbi:MAG: BlaI/MecI/CopY family transcriptional regulator [Alistipes finegoldii]
MGHTPKAKPPLLPARRREQYARGVMSSVLTSYFDGSLARMVSFFSRNEDISVRRWTNSRNHAERKNNIPATARQVRQKPAIVYMLEVLVCSGVCWRPTPSCSNAGSDSAGAGSTCF